MLKLVIGNRNYSSWSLRAWLYMRQSGLEFDTVRLALFADGWPETVKPYSPSGRVPVLLDGEMRVWDSLAIMLHLSERFPESLGWPSDPEARARAQSMTAEMHSGFIALRDELPQNLRANSPLDKERLSSTCRQQMTYIISGWSECRVANAESGPWLFGDMGIVDVMYAPVALRFRTYGLDVPGPAGTFMDAINSLPAVQEWTAAAREERESLAFIDERFPADATPLVPG